MRVDDILAAARADLIPEGQSGLWFIRKIRVERDAVYDRHGRDVIVPAGIYTHLFRMTAATMNLDCPGECVMEDTPPELRTHLNFMMRAQGRVLVTGLGLGCVIRGLLVNPAVEHITCIEQSVDVIRLVQPYMPKELTIEHNCALQWTKHNRERFDCAWHDLWSNREAGEPHLDRWHTELILNCRKTVGYQGAWNLDRRVKRLLRRHIALI